MSNNTYNNAIGGIPITINGTNASAFVNSINSANIYGITANVSSNKVNIIYANPGPFYINETDIIDHPLANAGIGTGEYITLSNITVISGNVSNPTFNTNSYFGLGINWNSILNSLPQSSRKAFKCLYIASPERQAVGTNGYRILNIFANTVSPTIGHPWSYVSQGVSYEETPNGFINGTNTIFNLQYGIVDTQTVLITLNGDALTQGVDYNISGGTNQIITFTFAPASGSVILASYSYSPNPILGFVTSIPSGILNNINTVFTLPSIPSPALSLKLFYNGLLLDQTIDYNITNSTITLNFAPIPTGSLLAIYRTSSIAIGTNYADSIIPTGTVNGINTIFSLPNTPNPQNSLEIFYNGMLLKQAIDYNLIGNIITYSFAPTINSIQLAFYTY
jgi:hypothetical protein